MDTLNFRPEDLLPHKSPMVLLDRVLFVDLESNTCECETEIHAGAPFFVENHGVPAFVAVEYAAQTVGVLSGIAGRQQQRDPQLGLLLGFEMKQQVRKWFLLGERLQIRVHHEWGDQNLMQFSGTVFLASNRDILSHMNLNVFRPEDPDRFLKEALI